MQTVNGIKTAAAKALLIKHAVALSSAPSEANILFFLGQAIEDTASAILTFGECQKVRRLANSGYTPTEAALVTHTEMCNLLGIDVAVIVPPKPTKAEREARDAGRSLAAWSDIILNPENRRPKP